MPNISKQYQLILGTFIDDKFVWHDVGSYDDQAEAYKEYKKYVNEQLKYSDDELVKVWNSGRLDIELRRGNKLLNWTGIYTREVPVEDKDDNKDEDDDDNKDVKDAAEGGRLFEDERGYTVTEDELRKAFAELKRDEPEEWDLLSFEDYVDMCTGKHGTLTEIRQ